MKIKHDKNNQRFVLPLENGLEAKIEYRLSGENLLQLVHSEVPRELRGRGVGKELVLKTFEKLTEEGYEALAVCSYVRAVAKSHPIWSKKIN